MVAEQKLAQAQDAHVMARNLGGCCYLATEACKEGPSEKGAANIHQTASGHNRSAGTMAQSCVICVGGTYEEEWQ
eukprot:1334397-Ditylum_brightwellii.AAC.1